MNIVHTVIINVSHYIYCELRDEANEESMSLYRIMDLDHYYKTMIFAIGVPCKAIQ